jgi:hypothetical protein
MALLDIFATAQENAGHLATQCAPHAGAAVEFARISLWETLKVAARGVLYADDVTRQTQADASLFTELRAALAKWSLQEEKV